MQLKKEIKIMLIERKIVQELITGQSNRRISREFKVCQKKVARLKKLASEYGYLDKKIELPPYPEYPFPELLKQKPIFSENEELLLPYIDWIKERLNSGWHKVTVFEESPIKVPRASFYRFMKRHKLLALDERKNNRVIPEIFHKPGESLLLDWGLLRTVVDPETGKKRKLWAFVGVLGYSRLMVVRLVWKCDTKTTIQCLEDMFREIGGVPDKLTTDNPKCFALEASKYEPIFNPAFERFAQHSDFIIECLPPRDPQKKGKVERLMPFIRRLCEAYGDFISIEHNQDYLNKKLEIANDRKHGTTLKKPFETFINEEVSHLKPLPSLSYEIEEFSDGQGREDGYIRFNGKYYSIGTEYYNKKIFIIANHAMVSFYSQGKLIETHKRIDLEAKYKSTKKYHLKEWEQISEDHSAYLERAKKIGQSCVTIISILLSLGRGFVDTRIIWGILSLDKKYNKEFINDACEKSLQIKSYSYRTVKSFILNGLSGVNENKNDFTSSNKKHDFTRDIEEYQNIL